jgi:hypothetical protein
MDSQEFDPSGDPILSFTSEKATAQAPAPAPPRPPASVPTQAAAPTVATLAWDAAHVFDPHPRRQASRVISLWFVAAISVGLGAAAGFAAGYLFAQRVVAPTIASASSAAATEIPSAPSEQQATESRPAETDVPAVPPDPHVTDAAPTSNAIASAPAVAASTATVPLNPPPATTAPTRAAPAPVADAALANGGAIEVVSRPAGAQVFIDGQVIGQAPLSIADVAEGTHDIRLELAGFNPWVTSVRVSRGARTRVGASLAR